MNKYVREFIYITLSAFLFLGCAYQQTVAFDPPGMPEQIYKSPEINNFKQAKVGVFGFSEPVDAQKIGRAAAESVFYALLENNIFADVANETHIMDDGTFQVMEFAQSRGYDLVVTGELIYYRDGVSVQPSQVAERMKVIHVPTQTVIWHCETVDTGQPVRDTDYIFIVGSAAPPPPAGVLLRRNAQKFCRLLLDGSAAS